jgi:hypothetical protein
VIGDFKRNLYVNSDVFGVGLSELMFVEQRTYQNDDGEMGRSIYGSHRAAGLKMLARRHRQKAHGFGLYRANISLNY